MVGRSGKSKRRDEYVASAAGEGCAGEVRRTGGALAAGGQQGRGEGGEGGYQIASVRRAGRGGRRGRGGRGGGCRRSAESILPPVSGAAVVVVEAVAIGRVPGPARRAAGHCGSGRGQAGRAVRARRAQSWGWRWGGGEMVDGLRASSTGAMRRRSRFVQ